ncbi:MAG TPA: OmpA family protein, partial [Calditrichaeota bacterium]|nr:OmpA family protein [Calditrichota bacterium]
KFFIVGHTDNTGNFASNKTLSEKRAKAVMNELIMKYNVSPQQIESYGVANLSPRTSNKTEEGRAKNRRVEIVAQ